jgi:hypothetical protein
MTFVKEVTVDSAGNSTGQAMMVGVIGSAKLTGAWLGKDDQSWSIR